MQTSMLNRYRKVRAAACCVLAVTLAGLLGVNGCPVDSGPLVFDDGAIQAPIEALLNGRQIFRHDTFGSEAFWGGGLLLHEAIAGAANGGVGPGLSPRAALDLGLKVDRNALPAELQIALANNEVDLDDPAVTVELLRLDAVVGIRGFFNDQQQLSAVGIHCALCHSTVDDSFSPGIGNRLDGWANRDLNIGAIVALAPDLTPFAEILSVSVDTVRTVLNSWGPGKFDAELILDGKAFQPDGRSAATLIPPAFGMAGINLHTWTGFGSVPYWNAFVAVLEMHGQGTFFDERLQNADQFPVAAANGFFDVRPAEDLVTSKLPDLHFYQLALDAPRPPAGSFDEEAAQRGRDVFNNFGCARCHVPPLFTEPGFNMHLPEEIGIDDFQANRSPEFRYRTSPLRGLWTHTKGGFFHDGRFPTLQAVIDHYDEFFNLGLSAEQKVDLEQYLLSL